jgi:glycosyltransferase involved in cell wall biosynthesis
MDYFGYREPDNPKVHNTAEEYSKENKIKFKRNIFSIYFCGRINFDVFNFELVFKSLRLLNENKIDFHFYIAGYGALDELTKKIENYSLSENVSVLGFVNKFDHATLLKSCNVFIAPFINKKNFSSNFTNKFIEAIQNKLLIITPLKGDVSKFIISNKIGLIGVIMKSSAPELKAVI